MKSLVLLLCFAQLWGCQSAPQGTGLGFRELACDDPEAEQDVRKLCPRCPLLTPFNDTNVVHTVNTALAAFNTQNNGTYFKLVEISRAQNVPLPVSTLVEFVIAATDCTAKEVTDPAKCNLLAEKQHGFCKANLMHNLGGEEVSVA
ncbi:alpha-2-HS-glycoprotein, isoform CRA_b, partial [Mus musculus]